MTLTRAVQCDLTWTEDRAPVKTDPSAAPGAETEGRAVALNGAARPSLRDRHLCDKPSRPEAATQAAWSRTLFPYALPSRFQFTLNQDRTTSPDLIASPLHCFVLLACDDAKATRTKRQQETREESRQSLTPRDLPMRYTNEPEPRWETSVAGLLGKSDWPGWLHLKLAT